VILLLDTCAVIWLGSGIPLAAAAATELESAAAAGRVTLVSPISAWELGLLVSRGRMPAATNELALLGRVLDGSGMRYADLSPEVLVASCHLPGLPSTDPADRIIIATARQFELCIVTRDRKILDYADRGHVMALAC
jgi:PIN domain nuclease of toxin-antitoxin system